MPALEIHQEQFPTPISCATVRKGTVYLELLHTRGGVLVRPAQTSASNALNPFWPVWLRQLILDGCSTKHGYSVRIEGDQVKVDGTMTRGSLFTHVYYKASLIRPLSLPPMKRRLHGASSREMWWSINERAWKRSAQPVTEALPKGAEVSGGNGVLRLTRKPDTALSLAELAKMVEWKVAQICAT